MERILPALLNLDVEMIKDFVRSAYGQYWNGYFLIEIAELEPIDPEDLRKTKFRRRKQITYYNLADFEKRIEDDIIALNFLQNQPHYNFYFSGGLLDNDQGQRGKARIQSVPVLWVDVDDVDASQLAELLQGIPVHPSGVVRSGGGYQLFWKLSKPIEEQAYAEAANQKVHKWVTLGKVDGTWNMDRLLRLPGTWNTKPRYPEAQPAILEWWNNSRVYDINEIMSVGLSVGDIKIKDTDFVQKFIVRGECFDEKGDRSTRDFAIVKELLRAGHSTDDIHEIFKNPKFGCSDKAIDRSDSYIDTTVANAIAELGDVTASVWDDGMVCYKKTVGKNGLVLEAQISNFCMTPLKLKHLVEQDQLCIELEINLDNRRKKVLASSGMMTLPMKFIDMAQFPGMSWTGSATDFQAYIQYLSAKRIPQEESTSVVGWRDGSFVTPTETWFDPSVSYADYIGNKFHLSFGEDFDAAETAFKDLYNRVSKLHHKHVAIPILGWLLAAPFAPKIRDAYRDQFPLLFISGKKGMGKTTIVRALMRILCGVDREYSAGASPAVLRRALMSTNALPVYIDEYDARTTYKYQELDTLLRLNYQAGSAQFFDTLFRRMVDVPLYAPVAISGPTGFEDEALVDRAVNVHVDKLFTREDTVPILNELQNLPAGLFLKWWVSQPHQEWVESISGYREIVEVSDRQRMAFATIAAPLIHCSRKWWGRPIDLPELAMMWTKHDATQADAREDAIGIIDQIWAKIIRAPGVLCEGIHYKIDGDVLKIHQAAIGDKSIEFAPAMGFKTNITKKWYLLTLHEALTTGEVVAMNKVTRLDGKNTGCVWIKLAKFPLVMQEVMKTDE